MPVPNFIAIQNVSYLFYLLKLVEVGPDQFLRKVSPTFDKLLLIVIEYETQNTTNSKN